MTPGNMTARSSPYLGDEWDLFMHMMPEFLVEHINGNAMYSLEHNWTKYLYETFTAAANDDMFEDVAFDVACAMITMDALMTENSMFYAGWMAAMGNNMTYNWHSMLVGSYAITLFNTSFVFPIYIRHGSRPSSTCVDT